MRALLLASEAAFGWQVELFREVFPNAAIIRWYGQSEKVIFGEMCSDNSSYHYYPTYGMTESVGGSLIGTGFTSAAMPLIRYDTADAADLRSGPCPCGLPYAYSMQLTGRWDQASLWGHSWEPISTTALNFHNPLFGKFVAVQFQQVRQGDVKLLAVADGVEDWDLLRRAVEDVQSRVGSTLTVAGEFVSREALLSSRGKVVTVDQRLAGPA
ncbi:hypothetical protein HC251_07795 [Iamia sp. SCSIO 61187]|uniref:hypothetical protein n=1 Tax=Iamia sp. SCSIO 61187 TaxID=2722752 RepID=UPI001C639365|nr:hypothetical protein [Iamia sp. SCSIO 61187]QYG92352.1 hypothetical protein HC251_07795 [Iamia sp. SCSIO 61187]